MTDALFSPQDDADALAAEYVLGVLDLADRSAAEARLRRDPAFAASVAAWESRLSGLNDDYEPVPTQDLLPRIEARLFPVQAKPGRNWFGWLAGAGLAAAVVLAGLSTLPRPAAPLLATLITEDAALAYEARQDGDQMVITRVSGSAAPAGQVHELWIIAPDTAPLSLGLLEDQPLLVRYPAAPEGWTLAVTVEPAGGAPGGIPSGPVIVSAKISKADA